MIMYAYMISSEAPINVVNCLVGPQTEFELDQIGSIMPNISLFVDTFPDKKPVILMYKRTEDEPAALKRLLLSNVPNLVVYVSEFLRHEPLLALLYKGAKEPSILGSDQPKVTKYGIFDPFGICDFCGAKGVYNKPNTRAICKDCIAIDEGLKKTKKPPKNPPNTNKQ